MWVVGTITFSAKRSTPNAVDAVAVGAKMLTHTQEWPMQMGGGDRYLYCKKVNPHSGHTVHAVDAVNMGGGDI